jgi:hypothetical protein
LNHRKAPLSTTNPIDGTDRNHSNRLTNNTAFKPPNAKEFDIATRTGVSRA